MLFLGLQILDFCVFNRIKRAGFLGRLVQKSHVTHNRNNLEFWPNSICIIQHLVSCCDDTTFFHPSLFIQPHNFLRFFFSLIYPGEAGETGWVICSFALHEAQAGPGLCFQAAQQADGAGTWDNIKALKDDKLGFFSLGKGRLWGDLIVPSSTLMGS